MGTIEVKHNIGEIRGLTVIRPRILEDNRGCFSETYNKEVLERVGITSEFIQDNEVISRKGVLRGFHINKNHPQAKLVRVLDGEIYDVVIDLRNGSETYKNWYGIKLSAKNRRQLFIPEGFGHAYLALKDSRVLYKVTTHWIENDEIGFAWNSKEFNIDWPVKNPIQNEKDHNNPDFSELML